MFGNPAGALPVADRMTLRWILVPSCDKMTKVSASPTFLAIPRNHPGSSFESGNELFGSKYKMASQKWNIINADISGVDPCRFS